MKVVVVLINEWAIKKIPDTKYVLGMVNLPIIDISESAKLLPTRISTEKAQIALMVFCK